MYAILIGREDTLFCFPLASSSRRRGFNGAICNKKTILWIPACAGMTPVARKHDLFKFNRYIKCIRVFYEPQELQELPPCDLSELPPNSFSADGGSKSFGGIRPGKFSSLG